ncbi:DUF1934 domain-containing protein [Bacillus methanolicus]|uniref:DUF1934 domain-containing protein n=1 Tax=Bacillus methanolicus (strain MGA3 / ATCC 53907) TaxID=796606 RepID=I3EBP2_BACMM|nr:DUF1934 domain-containing protein [Bacillus methanolicus]AIE61594.1 hypothetical protein BMMGA3_16205 [Bacillus methanolicus MGA3]EIJ83913.1 hypothetical protein MGA3_01435 [Bacillus methanolicus MGA3]UQD53624.1 DUF1934 domain-containing protein [Bacillus methanolicus]
MSLRPAEQMPVKIKIKTEIHQDGNKETFEFITFGRYYQKGENSFLQYEEALEEGRINTTVKISGQEVLILRSGVIKMRMRFQEQKTLAGTYETPYGVLQTSASTKRLNKSLNKNTGSLELVYDLQMQGQDSGTYYMTIRYEEDGK